MAEKYKKTVPSSAPILVLQIMATLISSTRLLTPIGFFAISANFAVGTTHRPRPSPSKQFCSIYWFRGSEKYFFIFSKSRCICQTGICLAMDRLMAFTLKDPAVKLFRAPSPRWLSLLFCNKESTKKPFSFCSRLKRRSWISSVLCTWCCTIWTRQTFFKSFCLIFKV